MASSLGRALREAGFSVDDNAPLGRSSTWAGPSFVMIHHTVSSENPAHTRNVVQFSRTGTAHPPIYHIIVDVQGKLWMICRERSGQAEPGRSSHAGAGGPFMGVPRDRMNEHAIGVSAQNDGTGPISRNRVQYEALIRLTAFLCRRYNIRPSHVIGHKEWTPRKVDPRDSMATIRRDVERAMSGTPAPPPAQEEPQMDGFAEVTRATRQRVGTSWAWLTFDRNVRNTAGVHFRDGIFSVASRRFDIDLSASFVTEASARVSVQLMLVDQSGVARGSYPVQSFDVGGGLVAARFAGLSGFCPAQQRARIRVRSLDGPVEVAPYAVVKRWR